MEFELNIFPGFNTLQLVDTVQKLMNKMGDPEQFQGRIIFMSMFSDMIWVNKDNEKDCIANFTLVSLFAKRFPAGHWSFFGPGLETKWYSTYNERPRGEWDKVAELMMLKFGEIGHPVFPATSPLSRGTLKSKGGGKLSIHFCVDGDTIEAVFRTLNSVHQLSIYWAVSDLCEEYGTCQTRTGRPVLAELSDPLFAPANLLMTTLTPSIEIPAQEKSLQKYKERVERLPQQDRTRFVLMQDSWKQLKSDSTSWRSTKTNSYNLQSQWHVVSIVYQEMKNQLTRRLESGKHQNWARVRSHNQLPAR